MNLSANTPRLTAASADVKRMTIAQTATPTRPGAAVFDGVEATDESSEWLQEVLGTVLGGQHHSYLGRPSAEDLRLLVPMQPRAAAAASLRRADNHRSAAKVAAGFLGRGLATMGLLRLAPGETVTFPRFALVEHLAIALGEPELLAAVTIGQRRRNRKPVLQLLTPCGRVVGFAKVGWSPLTNELVNNEADMLRLVEGRLPKGIQAPTVLLREPWKDGFVVVTSPLKPRPVIEVALDRAPAPDLNEIVKAIASAQGQDQQAVGGLDLFDHWRHAGVGQLIDLEALRRRHGSVLLDVGLWHGDFTPWNLLIQGSAVSIWDWEFAGLGRPVGFDALHSDFEEHRRASGGNNRDALQAAVARSGGTLASLGVGHTTSHGDAIVDLYLCELIARELNLDGQRWSGGDMAGLAPDAVAMLEQRASR